MPSPHQTPDDAAIEPQIVADLCTGDARLALAVLMCFAEDVELLRSPRKEQRCRRVKERIDYFGMARAQEKAPLRDSLPRLLLLQRHSDSPRGPLLLQRHRRHSDSPRGPLLLQRHSDSSRGPLLLQRHSDSPRGPLLLQRHSDSLRRPLLLQRHSDSLRGRLLLQRHRLSMDDDLDLCGKLSWAVRHQIMKVFSSGVTYLHGKSVIHRDLKPQNILLDDCCVPKISDYWISRLFDGSHNTAAPKVRAAGTHNKPSYVEFVVATSAKGGAEITIGSHVIRVPKYLSVHHPVVQMVLFARNKFADTFACCKSMAPKSIFDMAKRLHASALSNWWKTDWNSARTKSETPNVGTFSDISTGQSIVQRNELTGNESPPSDTDASGAAWVAATAAPHHATGNRELLSGFIIEHDDQFVHAVDGIPRKVLARGAVITDSVVLPDVWFVPGLTENLVSVSQLVDLDHSVGFSSGECFVRSADCKVVGKGHLQEGGIYVLDFLKVPLAI